MRETAANGGITYEFLGITAAEPMIGYVLGIARRRPSGEIRLTGHYQVLLVAIGSRSFEAGPAFSL